MFTIFLSKITHSVPHTKIIMNWFEKAANNNINQKDDEEIKSIAENLLGLANAEFLDSDCTKVTKNATKVTYDLHEVDL